MPYVTQLVTKEGFESKQCDSRTYALHINTPFVVYDNRIIKSMGTNDGKPPWFCQTWHGQGFWLLLSCWHRGVLTAVGQSYAFSKHAGCMKPRRRRLLCESGP